MTPSFIKDEWQPGPTGHVLYINGDDVIPSINVSHLKDYFKHMLQRDDEGMFWMNWLRNHIERHEDMANMHYDAAIAVPKLQGDLNTMFSSPEFENVLVDDTKTSVVGVNGVSLQRNFESEMSFQSCTIHHILRGTHVNVNCDSRLGLCHTKNIKLAIKR